MFLVLSLKSAIIRSRHTILCTALLVIICVLLSSAPNVYAMGVHILQIPNTNVQILQVQYPASVIHGDSSTIDIKAHVKAIFGSHNPQGEYGVLLVGIGDVDNNGTEIFGSDVTVTSQPDACKQGSPTGSPASQCSILALSASYDEIFDFTFGSSHVPASPVWHLEAVAIALDTSGKQVCPTTPPCPFDAHFTFTISIVQTSLTSIQSVTFSSPSTTTSYSSVPSQSALSQGQSWFTFNNYVAFLVFMVAAGVVVIFIIWNHGGPSSTKPSHKVTAKKQAATQKEAPPARTEASGKAFCINCGKELPPDWKFCRHCGTKQP